MAAVPIFAQGTDQKYVDTWTSRLETLGGGGVAPSGTDPINLAGSRWANPASGPSPNMGDPSVVTWSIVPDGTQVSTIAGGLAPSNLIAFMDGIYGGGTGPVANRPWFNIIQRAYDNWAADSGLSFIYEPSDDGADYSNAARGVLGVRGDVRIGGNNIDGNFGILAFNFFPNGSGNSGTDGDMVIDTNDIFYSQNANGPTGENRALSNVLMHEAGHGIGLGHVIPVNETKLMEPFASLAFLGAQYDDVLAAQTLYGDNDEPNDTLASAKDLGTLSNGTTNLTKRSIDRNGDVDLYKFTVGSAGILSLTLSPDGRQYDVGPQGGTANPVNTFLNKDLSFNIEQIDGRVLATVSSAVLGQPEVLTNFALPGGGTYVIRALGTGAETQPYSLRMTLSGIVNGGGGSVDRAPRLLSVEPNSGELFSTIRPNTLTESPRELVFRFDTALDPKTLAAGIRIMRAGGDGAFGATSAAADSAISPAFLNFGENERIVVARFSQPLPDDLYRVEIFGADLPSESAVAIKSLTGNSLSPRKAGTDRDTYVFDLELGTTIVAVVPQPVDRVGNVLTQRRRDIEVYFSDTEIYNQFVTTGNLSPNPTVVDPQFYNLILTKDSVNPNDDLVFNPNSITYDPVAKKATLTFVTDIDQLPGVLGSGTFRLRVGSSETVTSVTNNSAINTLSPTDPAGFLSGAADLGSINGTFSSIINQQIVTESNPLLSDYPGSNFEPGHRDIQDETHLGKGPDAVSGTTTMFYSFMDNQSYGVDIAGRPLFTSITPDQKQRVREIFEFYSMQLGIDVAEHTGPTSAGDGIKKIVVGDMAPNGSISGPGDVAGVAQLDGELAIMDGAESWDNGFGNGANLPGASSFFNVALHEIGHLIGLGHTYDLPPGTVQGSEARLNPSGNALEQIFPGAADVIHGQHLYRPDNRDVDLYKFVVQPGARGELRAETFAERLNSSSTLDTYLTLLRRESDGSLSIVAANNNYFSDDSMLRVNLEPGEYYLSVTGKGNEDNNPLVSNSGSGAVSQGQYQLRIDFKSTVTNQLSEQVHGSNTKGTALDGDGDGIAGGNFDFWFRAAAPFTPATNPTIRTLFVDKAFTGSTRNGSLANPFNRIDEATAVARPGDIIRLVGDNRTPNNLTDDNAYEIGNGGASGGALRDGVTLDVPRGVTMMIDAGAILKFGGSKILVGSNDSTTNRSNAAIQVLGLPTRPVYFTSYNDESLGRDTNPLSTTPVSGNWGGIEIRTDVDRSQGRVDLEREGIFLNTISNADIRYGGGLVGVGTLARVISPIDLTESRPLILNNRITLSSDSAISVDPNSFEETLFTEWRYQQGFSFAVDYTRVGPDIRSNTIFDNSVNGLFVRIDTLAGQNLKPLSVPGRINESEITIVLGENLIVEGTPGGPLHETVAPVSSLVTLTSVTPTSGTGFASNVSATYLITYVDKFGQESLPSAPRSVLVQAGRSVRMNNLPTATVDYVSRKIWRQENNTGSFKLVAILNRDDTSYVDNGLSLNGVLLNLGATEIQRARRDASLVIDPGVVVKSSGGRIELGVSATMLAEGTKAKPIVFTSRKDDRYGAGGTFDTNDDGNLTSPAAGDWSGIMSRHLGELSIDNALITFGGGTSRVPGGFASFNAIEVHQSTARITNSVIEDNASGTDSRGNTNRDSRGVNESAAIYIVGSQPVFLNNLIRNNSALDTAAVSIDANSLNTAKISDYGRMTGLNRRESIGVGNSGPLISNNRLGGNALNGMVVRGATLTTESVWDDTDIVHILMSEIVVPDFHTYGGLRLTSKSDESLVVKLNTSGGFTATGRPLDIKDRIGGSLQLLGAPGFPVVLTSLADDTIGAGFDFSGQSLVDTNGNGPSTGTPGDWRSVLIQPFSNDRNVDFAYERESDQLASEGVNDFPSSSQDLGALANNLNGGDENLRLGVTLTGSIAIPSDVDVYRFTGVAGTMLWIDIDQTSGALDTILEVIDGNGQIIALSDNSIDESTAGSVFSDTSLISTIRAFPMDQEASVKRNVANGTPVDFLGVNPLDAGLRVVLSGVVGSSNNYYLRVRSSNVTPEIVAQGQAAVDARVRDVAAIKQGISVGGYKLQLRLQQTDEVAGSTIRYADIRYAINGVDAQGQPGHSQLTGEVAEANPLSNNVNFTVQNLGNIASNDRAGVSIAGQLVAGDFVDFYSFRVERDSIQETSETPSSHTSVVFDMDYADGAGRANTQLWIFQDQGNGNLLLVATADDSNILDDQPSAIRGSDQTDLTRGSFGKRDAYIGPFELPQGNYVVAVSNKSRTHFALTQFSQAQASGAQGALSNIRLEPIDSVSRISEDRFDTISPLRPTTAAGPEMVAFSPASAVPFNLSDITLFVSNGAARNVNFTNPLTGAVEAIYSTTGTSAVDFNANGFTSTNVDLAVAPDGRGITYQRSGVNTDANPGRFISVDVGSGGLNGAGATLQTSIARAVAGSNPVTFEVVRTNNTQGDGMVFDGFTFSDAILENGNTTQSFWGVARHARNGSTVSQPVLDANLAVVGLAGAGITKNVLYRLTSYGDAVVGTPKDPVGVAARNANQSAFGAGTNTIEHGYFVRQAGVTVNAGFQAGRISGFIEADGIVTGLASVGNRLYAVTNQGELMSMVARDAGQQWSDQYTVILDENGDPIQFSGVTNGPRNLNEEGVDFSQILFGVTTAGRMYAFDTNGVLQNIFPRGANFIDGAGLVGATGIDFSSLDVNLFHLSSLGATDTSHGRQAVFNNSSDTQAGGGNSLRFGFADPNAGVRLQPGIWNNAYNMPTLHNTVAGPGGARGAIESNLIDLREYSADDQPMLYFDYNLGTEANNGNAIGGAVPTAVDTFRVYGSGEDGNWILLGTNNDIATNPSTRKDFSAQALGQGSDEFDVANSGNVDAYGRNYVPSELFDRGEWRQARINLASLAGKRDVKIRFEFSTSGDFRSDDAQRGGVELVAVEGHRINDGETFVIDHGVVGQTTFEFELGLVLNIPSGASIQDGDQIKIGADLLTFSNNGGPKDIPFNALNTPTELADAVLLTLVANNYTVTRSPLTRNVLSISALAGNPLPTPTSTLDYQVLGADDAIIIGEPGVAAGNIPVLFDQTMTAVQVRDAVRTSLAAAFNVVGQETNIQVYRVRGNSILLHDTVGLTVVDSGPLTLSGAKIGDQFGPSDAGPNRFFEASRGARNNNVSGLQIDDIIIGFAERGETVYNASTAFNTFVNTPSYEPIFASGTTGLEEIEEGTYQLEIRTAADYGANQKNDPRLYFVDPATQAVVGRTIKTNDRLAKSYQLVLTSTSDVRDGDTFTLSDGYNVVTFEFDITTSAADRRLGIAPGNVPISVPPNATLEEMARAIRDGINSPGAQSMIKITAENGGDMDGAIAATGPRSVVVQLHGKAAGDILGNFALSANPGLPIQLVLSGQDTVFGEDLGDGNIKRDQGQFIISSSSISNSRGFGLNIDAAAQSQGALSPLAGQRPYPGAVRNLINLNSANVSPGVVVMNNVINRNLAGGIRVSGETVVTNGIAPSSVARIINNTLFGNKAGNDTGISVDENATPTILNNILANFVTGIQVASSNSTANTVLGGNIYQSNTANVAPFSLGASESFAIALPPTAPLFIDGANGYFYLRSLSQAIDSSIASLENRATLEEVKNAVGLPTSPLLAPSFDVNGLRRSDDPAVNSPAGLGQNVFIDRGAIDRVDFVGPIAVLQRPLDNDSFGVDSDPFNTYVRVNTNNFDFFEVLLDERTGTGTDARTVTAATVVVTENGRPLFEGVDYIFGFSANSRTIRLTPLAGYWRRESVYEITLINKPTLRIDAVSGATLLDGDTINLTTTSGNVATLEYDSGYVLGVPQTLTYVVPSQGSFGGGIADGQTFTITNGALVATFEFDTNNSIGAGNRRVAIAADQTTTQVRNAILAALSSPANADLNLAVRAVGTDSLQLGSLAVHATDVSGSRLSVRGTAAGVADGQLFTFDPIDGPAVTFEFNYTGDLNVLPGNQVITINRTDTPDEIAGKIATAMKPFVTNGFAPVQSVGLGSVYVGGKIGDTLTVSSSALTVQGAPGTSGSYTLSVPPAGGSSINDATQFSIRNSAGVLVVFEFNKDANVGAGNRGIFIRDTDTAADVALAVANAISVAGLGMTPTATGASIKLNEVRGTVVNVMTSPLTLSGVSGGAIAIPFVPSASFNSNLTATQLMTALASVGLGVKSYSLGYGTLLIEGLSSLTGVSTTLINPISDLASNWLQPNRANSLTQFTIVMPEVSIDFGDAIERPNTFATSNTLFVDNGVRHAIYPEDVPQLLLGRFVDGDVDGSPSVAADGDDSESSFVFSAGLPLGISSAGPARVTVSAVSPTMLGKQFTITDPSNNSVTYQFTDATQGPVPTGVIGIDLTGATTPTIAAARVQAAVLQSILDGDITGIISVLDGDVVALGGTSAHRFDLSASAGFVQRVAKGSIGLTVPASVAGLAQGQTLEIQDGSGNTVVFQVVDTVAPIAVVAGNVALPVTIAGATQSSFATAVAKAINDAIASNKLRLPPATIVGNAVVVDADDEDGVRFNGFFNPKTPAVQTFVTSSDSGYLDAWIDWNQDNDFDDAGELILQTRAVQAGENVFTVSTPVGAVPGYTTARFRLSATGGLFTYGLAVGGEVEDYVIEVLAGEPPVAVNDPDLADADKYRVNEDGVLTVSAAFGVLKNDTDSDTPKSDLRVYDMDVNAPGVQPVVTTQNGTLVLNADGSFVYTPAPNFNGQDTFVYQVTDPRMVGNQPATVTITVNPVNDVPFANNDTITISEDAVQAWSGALFTSNDVQGITLPLPGLPITNEAGQNLRVKSVQLIDSTGAPLVPRTGETLSVAANTINYRPGSNYNSLINGPVRILLEVEDDGVSGFPAIADPKQAFSTLTVNITAVNDRPEFTIPNQTISITEDPVPGNQVRLNFLSNILAGPAADLANGVGPADDELGNIVGVPGQNVSFLVRAIDPSRFTATGQPAVIRTGTDGAFTFTLAPDVNSANSGPILVEVIAQDDGGGTLAQSQSIPQTITLLVTPVNDAPEFTISTTSFNTVEDAPRTVIANFLSNITPGPVTAVDEVGQSSGVTVDAVTPEYFSIRPRIIGAGDLEFQLAPNVNSLFTGSLNIVITVTDNGTPNATTTKTLTITAADINDAPSFSLNKAQVIVPEDNELLNGLPVSTELGLGKNIFAGPAGIPGVGAADENGLFPSVPAQTLTFNLTISNPGLFSQQPVMDSAGNLTFKTAPNRSGSSVVVVRLSDDGRVGPPPNNNLGPTATFTIVVTPVNDAPEFVIPASRSVNEDQGVVSVPGFATGIRPGPGGASDESNQELRFIVTAEDPSVFLVPPTIQPDGTLVFQTAKDVNNNTAGIKRRIFVSLIDSGADAPPPNDNLSDEQTFVLDINPVNDSPIPDVLTLSGVEDQALDVDALLVTAGDAPGPADESAQLVRMTQIERTTDKGGVVTPVFSGGRIVSFRYQPPLNLVGDDIIRYVVSDNGVPQESATGTITIQLSAVNDAPQFVAGPDITVPEDVAPFSAAWATNILAGPPSAIDEISGATAQTVAFEITTNNDALFAIKPFIDSAGVLSFTLARDANGRAVVDVTAVDSGATGGLNVNRSVTSKLTIIANPVNDAPGFNVLGNITIDEDSSRYSATAISNIVPAAGMNNVPATGTDEVGQTVTILTSNSNPSLFSVQPFINSAGVLEFVPAQDATGSAIVSVIARDNGPNTLPNVNESAPKTFTITLRPVNDAPIGVNDRYTTGEDTVLTVNAPGLLSNDRDADFPGDTISIDTFQATSSLGAIVSVLPDGSFSYDSRNSAQLQRLVDGETATDTFTYTLRDAAGLTSNLVTATIVVSGVNDSPVAVNDSFSVPFGISELLNVLANDKDPDSTIDPRTVEIGQLAAHGTAVALSTGRIEYRPAAGYRGPDSFTYRVRDAFGAISNEAIVTIVVNTAPVAVSDAVLTTINTPVVIDVLRNDADPDGTLNRASVSIASGPDVGSATVNSDGTIRYVPPADFIGTATLQYAVLDNEGLSSNLATVTVRVTGSIHQNPTNRLDVNNDGFVSPIDVLIVVNDLNFNGTRVLPSTLPVPPYLDVNGDRSVSPLDVLELINFINQRGGAGAGEGEGSMASLGYSQQNVLMVPEEEIIRASAEIELQTEMTRQLDLAVASVVNESVVYGPALPTVDRDSEDSDDTLESYLASWVTTKNKKSGEAIDSVFTDESWL